MKKNKEIKKKIKEKTGLDFKEVKRVPLSPKLKKEIKDLEKELAAQRSKQRTWKDMRILWFSVAPYIKSGYGVVTKNFVSGLIKRGFSSMVVAYYGLAKGGFLKVGNIVTFPIKSTPGDNLGFKTLIQHHKKFGTDIVVFMTDYWVAKPLTNAIKETVAYTVLDHKDYAEEFQDVLRSFYRVAIASKFGVKEAKKYGVDAFYVPHGVDTKMYYPLPKEKCKQSIGIDPKSFVLGIVAANNDKEPRKGWDKMFSAIKIFLDNNPKMKKVGKFRVFCHTDAVNNRGYDLKLLAKRVGIGKYVIFQDPYMAIIGLPDKLMNRIYNSFDVLLNLSRREGYCLPMVEAQACKVPCIATDFSAMTERQNFGKCGWLVKAATTMISPLGGVTAIPDEFKAAEAIEEAVFNKKKRELFSKRSFRYAKKQTWDIALDKYFLPFLKEIGESLPQFKIKKYQKMAKKIQMVEGYE